MMYIPMINDYLEIVTHKKVKDFLFINVYEYFKSISEKQNLRNVEKSLFLSNYI